MKQKFGAWARRHYLSIFGRLLRLGFSPKILSKVQNLRFYMAGASTRFEIFDSLSEGVSGLVSEGGTRHTFSSAKRGLKLYSMGLEERGRRLFGTYRLENIDFELSDTVIDCGANYGDLWLELRHKIAPENYIAIEPSPPEFFALEKNLPKACVTVNKALGAVSGTMEFFQQDETGDSSLIEPPRWAKKVEVEVVTLDSLRKQLGLAEVKLLKLEAEGFEPEILLGAIETLSRCHYVAADGGYERGKAKEQTFTEISNFLGERGFEMVDIFLPWGRVLFRNRRF